MSKPKSDSGKGSHWRDMDRDSYRNNYDAIFNKNAINKLHNTNNTTEGQEMESKQEKRMYKDIVLLNVKALFSHIQEADSFGGHGLDVIISDKDLASINKDLKPMIDAGFKKLSVKPDMDKEGKPTGNSRIRVKFNPKFHNPRIVDKDGQAVRLEPKNGQPINIKFLAASYAMPGKEKGVSFRLKELQLLPMPKVEDEPTFGPLDEGLDV